MHGGTGKGAAATALVMAMVLGTFAGFVTAVPDAHSGDYYYRLNGGGGAIITDYVGPGVNVVVPGTLDGHTVVGVGDGSFLWTNIASITIPNSVTFIGNQSFGYCLDLSTISMGNGVTYIGYSAFESCESLVSIDIPNSVTKIGNGAFGYCPSLTAINVGLTNAAYNSADGVLFDKGISELIHYPQGRTGDYSVPISVKTIDKSAFKFCNRLTSVTVPTGVTTIENGAFNGCLGLKFINVSIDNLNYASIDGVLYDKTITKLLQYPSGKAGAFTTPGTVTTILSSAFYDAVNLTSITLSNNVKTIESYAFTYCPSLTSVVIGSGVTSIGNGAFSICMSLPSITIPESVTFIGDGAFSRCTSLVAFNVASNNPNYASQNGVLFDKALTKLIQYPNGRNGPYVVPSSVLEIGKDAFSDSNITSVVIPDSVTVLGSSAFRTCVNLTTVTMGSGIKNIQTYAFSECIRLENVSIGSNVDTISFYAYSHCDALTAITIPASVAFIGAGAFSSLPQLTSVIISGGVTSIGGMTFKNCANLTSITFLGLGCPTSVGQDWILNTAASLEGHAYPLSNFPTPGNTFHGLLMGDALPIVPSAPQNLDGIEGNDQISLAWDAPILDGSSAITGYNVYRAVSSDGAFSLMATVIGRSYFDTNVTNGDSYWYKVCAVNANGEGTMTDPLMYVPATVPSEPLKVSASYDGEKTTLTWEAMTSDGGHWIFGYHIYRSTSENGSYQLIGTSTETTYNDGGVTGGQTYWYKIAAYNDMGEGASSTALSFDTKKASGGIDLLLVLAIVLIAIVVLVAMLFIVLKRRKG